MTSSAYLSINETSKACGLSPSVLRIWEVRYGWPAPKRQPNGYRAYSRHQVDELRRMNELVKAGKPVSALIIDGFPRWPDTHQVAAGPVKLDAARSVIAGLHQPLAVQLVDTLEVRRGAQAKEIVQRSIWALRPRDEIQAVLVPTLVGLAELDAAERGIAEAGELRELVKERGLQLLRQHRPDATARWVVPANDDSHALAVVAAVALNQRGRPARYWYGDGLPVDEAPILVVGDGSCTVCANLGALVGTLPSIASTRQPSLVSLARGEWLPD